METTFPKVLKQMNGHFKKHGLGKGLNQSGLTKKTEYNNVKQTMYGYRVQYVQQTIYGFQSASLYTCFIKIKL